MHTTFAEVGTGEPKVSGGRRHPRAFSAAGQVAWLQIDLDTDDVADEVCE